MSCGPTCSWPAVAAIGHLPTSHNAPYTAEYLNTQPSFQSSERSSARPRLQPEVAPFERMLLGLWVWACPAQEQGQQKTQPDGQQPAIEKDILL